MGVSDDDIAVRKGVWGPWAARIVFGSFVGYLIWALFALGARAVHFLEPLPGMSLVPAISVAFGWWASSTLMLNITGGFVLYSHVLMAWLVAWIAWLFGGKSPKTRIGMINSKANRFWGALHAVSVLVWYLIGMGAGAYVGGLLAWAIIQNTFALQLVPQSPGPWPGLDAGFNNQAVALELIVGTILGAMITFFYLRDRAHKIPQAGAFIVGGATLLGFNVSGPAFDIFLWVFAHLAACTPSGSPTCFSTADPWNWVYPTGTLVGPLLGVIIGYIIHAMYPTVKKALEETKSTINGSVGESFAGAPRRGPSAPTNGQVDFAASVPLTSSTPDMGELEDAVFGGSNPQVAPRTAGGYGVVDH